MRNRTGQPEAHHQGAGGDEPAHLAGKGLALPSLSRPPGPTQIQPERQHLEADRGKAHPQAPAIAARTLNLVSGQSQGSGVVAAGDKEDSFRESQPV